jgi:dTDP-4-amino-4,6-dideoxygalactose transaminase
LSEYQQVLSADPGANYRAHKQEIDAAIHRVLESGWYILGQEVADFEAEFAAWNGNAAAIGVANGTDALELALRACGIGTGDSVLTVSNTAVATVAAIELCGATPLFVDIQPGTYSMDPESLDQALKAARSGKLPAGVRFPKAVIPVHLYGHPVDMPAIMDLAERYGLMVVEDCAQAHGAALHGRRVGTWGHLGAFSLYPTKNLGALGDGGVIVTNDAQLVEQVKLLRQYGWRERYISVIPGGNSRLDTLQAAILRVKLRYLDDENAKRRKHAATYSNLLSSTRLDLPVNRPGAVDVYHQYVVGSENRDGLRDHLGAAGISTQVLYPVPIHLQPAYRGRVPVLISLEKTEALAKRILSLPIYAELDDEQVRRVAEEILNLKVSS